MTGLELAGPEVTLRGGVAYWLRSYRTLIRWHLLPGWLAAVNWWLPFGHMAVIVRDGLTAGLVTGVGTSYAVVAAWGVAGVVVSAWALGRRR